MRAKNKPTTNKIALFSGGENLIRVKRFEAVKAVKKIDIDYRCIKITFSKITKFNQLKKKFNSVLYIITYST